MEINRIKTLEAKYWEGRTSLSEEELFFNLSEEEQTHLSDEAIQLISMKSDLTSVRLCSNFENEFWAKVDKKPQEQARTIPLFSSNFFLKYAAVGVVLVSLGFSISYFLAKETKPMIAVTEMAEEDTYLTPEQALAETKRALLFASNKLNKGKKHFNELSRFDNSMKAAEANIK